MFELLLPVHENILSKYHKRSYTLEAIRFLIISGNPIDKPVAWQGLIAMNTENEKMSRLNSSDI